MPKFLPDEAANNREIIPDIATELAKINPLVQIRVSHVVINGRVTLWLSLLSGRSKRELPYPIVTIERDINIEMPMTEIVEAARRGLAAFEEQDLDRR